MNNRNDCNLDDETIRKAGLRISVKPINAQIAPNSRIFEYPHLENVFIMESDLYGNRMPKNSCFFVFNGKHGLLGKHPCEFKCGGHQADCRKKCRRLDTADY